MHATESSAPSLTTRLPRSAAVLPQQPLGAHAHSDCHQERPLLDALEHGFTSIEADVHLVDGELHVAHDAEDVHPDTTLENLYLAPLAERARRHDGRILARHEQPLQLLVDIKTDPVATYERLHRLLSRYRTLVTRFDRWPAGYRVRPRGVTVIVSGNRPRELIRRQRVRYAAVDGRLADLPSREARDLLPIISDEWTRHFSWTGTGPMPPHERGRLRAVVETAHREGRQVRFWGTPEPPGAAGVAVVSELLAAGVDYINADDLPSLRAFLLGLDQDRRAS
jgi:glycerophosphoryl diester phosphodiesterase